LCRGKGIKGRATKPPSAFPCHICSLCPLFYPPPRRKALYRQRRIFPHSVKPCYENLRKIPTLQQIKRFEKNPPQDQCTLIKAVKDYSPLSLRHLFEQHPETP